MLPQKYIDSFHGGSDTDFAQAAWELHEITITATNVGRSRKGAIWPTKSMTEIWETVSKGKVTLSDLKDAYDNARKGLVFTKSDQTPDQCTDKPPRKIEEPNETKKKVK